MKILIPFLFFLACYACNQNRKGSEVSQFVHSPNRDTFTDLVLTSKDSGINWQENFGLSHDPEKDTIWGKPVSYYINDTDCAGTARDFYFGYFRPGDNGPTDDLLKLAATGNNKLRPFYRWCLNKTIQVSDGALGEHTGIPARKYAEKFPGEFFEYMDNDTTGNRYQDWIAAIGYSGFYDIDDYNKPGEIRSRLVKAMQENCVDCTGKELNRIAAFAEDCFPK